MKIFVKGLNSCGMRRLNVQRYEDFLRANGHELVEHPSESQAVLLWTCAFRGDFRDNSIAEIKRYLADYQSDLIVVGCLPDIDREFLQNEYQGRFINWKNDEALLNEMFADKGILYSESKGKYGEAPSCDDVEAFRKKYPGKDVTFVDQFVKLFVAEGCNFTCSYCAEILAFPPYRSFPMNELVETCKQLVEETGQCKVMLLGDSIGDYGCDTGRSLPELIDALLAVDSRIQIALQGFNPGNFIQHFDAMKTFIEAGKIFHLQLPIQSASERLLQRMSRPYGKADIEKVFGLLNDLNFTAIDTHLLIGFPGETQDDVEETLKFILDYHPNYVLVSKYMESEAMPSSKLSGKVPLEEQAKRLDYVGKTIRAAGIICNTDNSDLSKLRCENLNRIDAA